MQQKNDGKFYYNIMKQYQETDDLQVKEVLRRCLVLLRRNGEAPVGGKGEVQ